MHVEITTAFIAGILSFLSPCVFPLVPGIMVYLAGISNNKKKVDKKKIIINSIIFVLGFSIIFAVLGILLNTILDKVSLTARLWLSRIGGLIIITFGLYVLNIIKIPYLQKDHKILIKGLKPSYFSSFLFGAAFAFGWTPCVGAVLGSILTLAAVSPGVSFYLLMGYALGLGIPFLIAGIFSTHLIEFISKKEKFFKYFNIVVGVLLIILGVLVFTQSLSTLGDFSLVADYFPNNV